MNTTHTPGPWSHQMNKDNSLDFFGDDGSKVIACNIRLMNQINNARLIASAPELLEILIEWVDDLEVRTQSLGTNPKSAIYQKAVAAISKATGQTP